MVTDDVFAVIAEGTRREILAALRSGDMAVGELVAELQTSQPTISKHLKVLREAELVSMRAQGQKRYYALNREPLEGVARWLAAFDVEPQASVPGTVLPTAEPHGSSQPIEEARDHGVPRAAGPGAFGLAAAEPGRSVPAKQGPGDAAVLERDNAELSAAVVVRGGTAGTAGIGADNTVPQQIGRTVGRAATKAADLIANLPKFGRKK